MTQENRFITRATWDAELGSWTDGPARYVMLRSDTLMGMFHRLPAEARRAALEALVAATAEAGGKSLQRYQATADLDAAELAAMLERTAAELGWGRPSIAVDGGAVTMTVRNSPFAMAGAPSNDPVCAPLAGIISAFASIVLDRPIRLREVACAAAGAEACRFEMEP